MANTMRIRRTSSWLWLPSFYRYHETVTVRKWDIHWLGFILICKPSEKEHG